MYDLPSQDNVEEVIVDASSVKGQTANFGTFKGESKSKNNKTSAA